MDEMFLAMGKKFRAIKEGKKTTGYVRLTDNMSPDIHVSLIYEALLVPS